jgi:hypothetical protein
VLNKVQRKKEKKIPLFNIPYRRQYKNPHQKSYKIEETEVLHSRAVFLAWPVTCVGSISACSEEPTRIVSKISTSGLSYPPPLPKFLGDVYWEKGW